MTALTLNRQTLFKLMVVTAMVFLLFGCANKKLAKGEVNDPYQAFNRQMYSFNRGIDTIFIKPIAGVYHFAVPQPVRRGVTNFFSNINDINVTINKVLQFKIHDAVRSAVRFAMNSTVGVGGLFDVASHTGLYKHRADFGLTLARYGMTESPYLVLPFLGPGTVRDQAGFFVDWYLSPWAYLNDEKWLYSLLALKIINTRANLLDEGMYVDYAAMDEYTFVRDIYLQRREALIKGINADADAEEWEDWEEWEGVEPEPEPVDSQLDVEEL